MRWGPTLLLVALLFIDVSEEAVLTSIKPGHFGDVAGVQFEISATGLSQDSFNYFNVTLGNRVFFDGGGDHIECVVNVYLSSTTRLVCNLGQRSSSSTSIHYQVVVIVDGVRAQGNLTVEYANWFSPRIGPLEPRNDVHSDANIVTFTGWFTTDKYLDASNPAESPTGRFITKVQIGDKQCKLVNETSGEYFGELTSRRFSCVASSTYSGPYNASLEVNDRGRSFIVVWAFHVNSKDVLYLYHTYTSLTMVSPRESNIAGGALVTVEGYIFDPAPGRTRVTIGGAECRVTEIGQTSLKCLAPEQSLTGPASGGLGILLETWEGEFIDDLSNRTLLENLTDSHPSYNSTVHLTPRFTIPLTGNYTAKVSGLLNLVVPGNYRLPIHWQGKYSFYLGFDGTDQNLVEYLPWTRFDSNGTQIYFELRLTGTGPQDFRLIIERFNAQYNAHQCSGCVNEKQRIRIEATLLPEVQIINNTDDLAGRVISLQGMTSPPINTSDPQEVRQALLDLSSYLCDYAEERGTSHANQTGFEEGDALPLGIRGTVVQHIEPMCGRSSFEVNYDTPYLYNTYEDDHDIRQYPYLCFAVRGLMEHTLDLRVEWKDKWGNNRHDNVAVQHGINSIEERWSFQCLNMLTLINTTWISKYWILTKPVILTRVSLKHESEATKIFVDEISISSLSITVTQARPSALHSSSILLDDIIVNQVDGSRALEVVFESANCQPDYPLLSVAGGPGAVNVTRERNASGPLRGPWNLEIDGMIIKNLDPDIEFYELQNKIEAAYGGERSVKVRRSGNCKKYEWTVEWTRIPGDIDVANVDDSNIEADGTVVKATVSTIHNGQQRYDPGSPDFFNLYSKEAKVVVWVNGYPSSCSETDCSFAYDDSNAAVISSLATSSDESGQITFDITGTGFNSTDLADYTVQVGARNCQVISITSTVISCTVTYLPGGNHAVVVTVQPGGRASPTLNYVVTHQVTSVAPAEGGTAGGYEVTISGSGFLEDLVHGVPTVLLGSEECEVTATQATSLTCIASSSLAGPMDVKVILDGITATLPEGFLYREDLSSLITSVSLTTSSVLGGQTLIITGTDFGTVMSSGYVKVGSKFCDVISWSDNEIQCRLPALPAGSHTILVKTDKGDSRGTFSIEYVLTLASSTPPSGSIYGGVLMTLKGEGFGTNCSLLKVNLGASMECQVQECSDTEIVCLTMRKESNTAVTPPEESLVVQVFLEDFEAMREFNESAVGASSTSCPVLESPLDGCNSTAPSFQNLHHVTDVCRTPVVTGLTATEVEEVSGLSGVLVRTGVELTLSGTGFGTVPCQSKVTLGQATGEVTASNDTQVTFTLDSQPGLYSLQELDVVLNVLNRGFARMDIGEHIMVVPVVSSFGPAVGSVNGGTLITIQGSGLASADGVVNVELGPYTCEVTKVEDSEITCKTPPAPEGAYTLSVRVSANQVTPINELTSVVFTYSLSTSATVNTISINGSSVQLTGSSFGTNSSTVVVTISKTSSRKRRSLEEEVVQAHEEQEELLQVRQEEDPTVRVQEGEEEEKEEEQPGVLLPPDIEEMFQNQDFHAHKVDSKLFDNTKEWEGFLGHLTGTSSMSFEDSVAQGVWRQGGSAPVQGFRSANKEEEPHSRHRRQVDEPATYVCVVSSVSDTTIDCEIEGLPAGSYAISVSVASGNAFVTQGAVNVVPTVDSIFPEEGSVHGGTLITVRGTKFVAGETSVNVGNSSCTIVSVTEDTLTCLTAPNPEETVPITVTSGGVVASSTPNFSFNSTYTPLVSSVTSSEDLTHGDQISIVGNFLNISAIEVFVDGKECLSLQEVDSTTITCQVPDLHGGPHELVARDTIYGNSNIVNITYLFNVTGVSPDTGSFGGGFIDISGKGFDPNGLSSATVCGVPCEVTTSTSSALTCALPAAVVPDDGSDLICDVTVTLSNELNFTFDGSFVYSTSLTPNVTSISPVRGGTGGGTVVTITGTDFSSSGNVVSMDGSPCNITSESETEIVCVTGPHPGSGTFPVRIEDNQGHLATVSEDFFYIDRWSSIYTWGGSPPPGEGEFVHIVEGQTIMLDNSTEVLKMLLISGHVMFDREAIEEIVLRAEYILIVDGGSLSVGSEEEPFENEAVIEMHGSPLSIELPQYGAKVIAVRNGTLDLHGRPIPVTWTHLAATTAAGDSTITLKQPVAWKVGDQIVLASTGKEFTKNENEKRTIVSVSPDGYQVTLDRPLEYEHISIEQTFGEWTIETRGEVGLLTRNVKVRGNINYDTSATAPTCDGESNSDQFAEQGCFDVAKVDQFGVTIMISPRDPDTDEAIGRISYTEVSYGGQAFQLGRYPIHYHLVGTTNASYVRGSSIHSTFNRALTMHDVNDLLVEHNVAYDNFGHAFFTEDGVEQFNIIRYNLAVYTRSSSSLLSVDVTPAGFWMVNPNNDLYGNTAAGGTHFGFWYRLEKHPSGPSATTSYCPNNERMGKFSKNTAHSQGRYGLWVFSMDGYHPRESVCSGRRIKALFESFTVWRTERGAELVSGTRIEFSEFKALDNLLAGIEFVEAFGDFSENLRSGVSNSVVVGASALTPEGCNGSGIVSPKKEAFYIEGVTFAGFDTGTCTALGTCSQCKEKSGGYSITIKNVTLNNTNQLIKFKWESDTIVKDLDGSFSGIAGGIVLPSVAILPNDSCTTDVPEFSINPEVPGAVCQPPLRFLRWTLDGKSISPKSLQGVDVVLTDENGKKIRAPYMEKRIQGPGWMAVLVSGGTYDVEFFENSQITNISYKATVELLTDSDFIRFKHTFLQTPDGFSTIKGKDQTSLDQLPDLTTSSNGNFFFDNSTNTVTYIVTTNDGTSQHSSSSDEFQKGIAKQIDFQVFRCFYEDCSPPTPPPEVPDVVLRWSDNETWSNMPVGSGGHPEEGTYHLPLEGDSIIIPKGVSLLVDTETPLLGRVILYGCLEFEDTMNHTFQAYIIYVQGGCLVAGRNSSVPFTHNLRLVLHGSLDMTDPNNEEMPPVDGGISIGWKALAMFGDLYMHGQSVSATWVKLGATAEAGSTQVTLEDPVSTDWMGKQVLLTPTHRGVKSEVRNVANISSDGLVLTLDSALEYDHLGVTHTTSDGSFSYTMAGEVALMTRNIVIEGQDYANLSQEGLGGRLLVSQFTADGVTYKGSAQLENVQFLNMGQLGWTDHNDPRFALVFYNLGDVSSGPSYVRSSTFVLNHNSAFGVYGTNNLLVEDNVGYRSVGPSVVDEGQHTIYRRNLFSTNFNPATYNGRTITQDDKVFGTFDLMYAMDPVLEGNVVAGSEYAAYRTYGQTIGGAEWNEAHSSLYGVMVWKKTISSMDPATVVTTNQYTWRIFETCFYFQTGSSVLLSEVVAVDCEIGTNQLVFGPPALSHIQEEKTATTRNAVFVGASPSHTCEYHLQRAPTENYLRPTLWQERGKNGGNSGILFPVFTSGPNMAGKTSHFFHDATTYPALLATSYIDNVTFVSFNDFECGSHVAMSTNYDAEDVTHPVFVSQLLFLDTNENNEVFIHAPRQDSVNPSDCVDMFCDGFRKIVITDLDGTLTGSPSGTVISMAEMGWGNLSHGIGDFRIPTALKTYPNGSLIPPEAKYPNKGILRDASCTNYTEWQAWLCTDITYVMMIIESMDSDTEDRRASPIALIGDPGIDGYVDLVNGPMDRGWCFEYTCQKRISTFYSVVATETFYEMAFTGTAPQVFRLYFLHGSTSDAVLLKTCLSKRQRYDVYVDNVFVPPKNIDNSKYPDEYRLLVDNPEEYFPNMSDPAGANYLERDTDCLHILLRGDHIFEIRTMPVVLLSVGVAVDIDDFFEENLVSNLASLLGIDEEYIRVVDVISEQSAKRKRRAGPLVHVEIEIGSKPEIERDGLNVTWETSSMSYDVLETVEDNVTDILGSEVVEGMVVEEVIARAVSPPEPAKPTLTQDEYLAGILNGSISVGLVKTSSSIGVVTKTLPQLPTYRIVDSEGNLMPSSIVDQWQMEVHLSGGPEAELLGQTVLQFENSEVTFGDLAISRVGEGYELTFSVVPSATAPDLSVEFDIIYTVVSMDLLLELISPPTSMEAGQVFNLTLRVIDKETSSPVDPDIFMHYPGIIETSVGISDVIEVDEDLNWVLPDLVWSEAGALVLWANLTTPLSQYNISDVSGEPTFFASIPLPDSPIDFDIVIDIKGKKKKIPEEAIVWLEKEVLNILWDTWDAVWYLSIDTVLDSKTVTVSARATTAETLASFKEMCTKKVHKAFTIFFIDMEIKFKIATVGDEEC
ncbi:fibrocystin-L-like [Oratosquilla oratoria]|uniref:fibrocystin-L-like n=1 Tax=Oratosquilla oratoria TaxID=337810 RepID=UPI003F75883D